MAGNQVSGVQWIYFGVFLLVAALGAIIKWPSILNQRSSFFVVAAMIALAVAGITFGAMKSKAIWEGGTFGGKLELGGSFASFVVVIFLALRFAPADEGRLTIQLTVPPESPVPMGTVAIMLADDSTGGSWLSQPKAIDNDKRVVFSDIPAKQIGRNVAVQLNVPDYELAQSGPVPYPTGGILPVSLRKTPHSCELICIVKDRSKPPRFLAGVEVDIGGVQATSGKNGVFKLTVPDKCGRVKKWVSTYQGNNEDGDLTLSSTETKDIVLNQRYR